MTEAHFDPEMQVVLFLIINLAIGFICLEINKRTNLPYTPQLVVCGILLRGSNIFWDQFHAVEKINPHSILIIFLPLLIFESSYSSRVDLLGKLKYQIFLLAVPGTIITIILLTFSLKSILCFGDDDMNWSQAIVLSIILATTDPVAVVAILKSLGAPIHVQTLIEMESLFNDGPAVILFTMLSPLAAGEELSISQATKDIFSFSLGGIALGFGFSYIVAFVIKFFMKSITTGYIAIAIISSYSLYFVCENYGLRVSGIFALVYLGFNFNKMMKDQYENHFQEQLHTCASMLETIFFFVSGIFIGNIFFRTGESSIDSTDWLKMLLFYICVIFSRSIMMFILYYPLKLTGSSFDIKRAIVVTWGGLRGALSISLVLIANLDTRIPERTRNLMLFNVVGISFLTLVINAPSFSSLLNVLKIKDIKDERTQFKGQVLNELHNQSKKVLEALKYDQSYQLVEWQGAEQLMEIDKLEEEISLIDQNMKKIFQNYMNSNLQDQNKLTQENKILQIARYHVIRVISRKVKEIQNKTWISNSIFDKIFESLDISSEQTFKSIDLWVNLDQHIIPINRLTKLQSFVKIPLIGYLISMYIHFKLEIVYEISFVLQIALSSTIKHLKDGKDIPQQLIEFTEIQQQIVEELQQQLQKAKYMIEEISMKFWNVVGKLQQRKAVQSILVKQSKIIDEFVESTYIPEKEGIEIKNQLTKKIEKLQSFYSYYQLTTKDDFIFRSAFKNYFTDQEFQGLLVNSHDCVFQPQQYITKHGQIEEYIYVITHGKIEKVLYPIENNYTLQQTEHKSYFETSSLLHDNLDKDYENPNRNSNFSSPKRKAINLFDAKSQHKNGQSLICLPSMNNLPNTQSKNIFDSPIKKMSPKQQNGEKNIKKVEFIEYGNYNENQNKVHNSMFFGIASMTGVVNLIDEKKESLIDIKALEVVSCKKIGISYLREVFKKNLKFQEYCYKRNLYQFLYMYPSKFGNKIIELDEDIINKLAFQSHYIHINGDLSDKEEKIICKYGGFLYQGKLHTNGNKQIYEDWSTISCSKTPLIPSGEIKMIVFKPASKNLKKYFLEASEMSSQFSLDEQTQYMSMNVIKEDQLNIKEEHLNIRDEVDEQQLKDISLNQYNSKEQSENFLRINSKKIELPIIKISQNSQQEIH